MKRNLLPFAVLVLLAASFPVALTGATAAAPLSPAGGAPTVVSYQGQLAVDGSAYKGPGYFKFAIVNNFVADNFWSNDGTPVGEPAIGPDGMPVIGYRDATNHGLKVVHCANPFCG